ERGIEDHYVRIAGQTRTGIKITDPVRNETTDINFPGFMPTPADMALLRAALDKLDATWFTAGGSLPPGIEPTIYRDLIRALKARGGKVLLDSSGEAFRYGIEAAPDIIKPNINELEELTGSSLPTDDAVVEAARKLVARGIGLVVISMGAKGACFVSKGEVVIQRAPKIEVKSTVGAGDAMAAGTIASLLRGLPLAESARVATERSLARLKRNAAL
ncbi:MAG TPA: 1-phosphofructokinase family hexose kinase, partial [Chthoniobacteraceae bacterium]|nr:1-phosphofructokinase family hexose kinase [Chthoniobacteraceae bacterium]